MGEITEKKTNNHGEQADPAEVIRVHFKNLPEPALHGFGRSRVGQSFKDEDKAS